LEEGDLNIKLVMKKRYNSIEYSLGKWGRGFK